VQWATASFLEVKEPVRGVNHPPPSKAEVKERVELCLYSSSVPSGYRVNFTSVTHTHTHTHIHIHIYNEIEAFYKQINKSKRRKQKKGGK
jgi:hypothetical protein